MVELLLLLAGFVLVAGGGDDDGGGSPSSGGDDGMSGEGTRKQQLWTMLRSVPELDDVQREFMMLTAKGEGNYNPKAHNDSTGEVAASAAAFTGPLRTRLRSWGYPDSAWVIGSGGRFGRLAPYFGDDWFDVFGTPIDPAKLFVSPYDLISALKNARALQQYDAFKAKPTVGTLRLGWWGPGKMKAPQDAARLQKYRDVAEGEKLRPGLIDMPIAPFPSLATIRAIGERLLAGVIAPPVDPTTPGVNPPQPFAPPNAFAALPEPWAARAVTDDAGFHTDSWWRTETHWIRVDDDVAGAGKGTRRWVVFDHNANVIQFSPGVAGTAAHAAQLAAEWIAAHL